MGQAKRRGNFAKRQGEAITKKLMENERQSMEIEELLKALPNESKAAFENLKRIVEQHVPTLPNTLPLYLLGAGATRPLYYSRSKKPI